MVFLLYYRHGMNAQCVKGFEIESNNIKDAVERARKHCEIMGYKYHFVRPLICDLDTEEKQHQGIDGSMKVVNTLLSKPVITVESDNKPAPGKPR